MVKCLAIFREVENSPNRESDDTLILKAVVEQLRDLKFDAHAMTPEQADREDLAGWDMIVPMCESYPRLMRLSELERQAKTLIINPPGAVLACYRLRMLSSFESSPRLLFPPTETRAVSSPGPMKAPAFDLSEGMWVKRGDVHNTCSHDVVFAKDMAEAEAIRADFMRREISHLLLQRHVDGDLIKFYGVGPGQWFTWFYHDPETARKLPFELPVLENAAALAARAVGVEVFGGDAIVAPDGRLYVIDINSWPSFARVRAEAARQIARHLDGQRRRIPAARRAA
jgi:hypothetical protein